jgi:predicted AAA+ superfamily ATPase
MLMFIKRTLEHSLTKYAKKFPVIAVIGPRQSGKTTLMKKTFPQHKYFSLENPDTLEDIKTDPRNFLG